MSKELQAGMWIAQGPEMDILVVLQGKAPMLEFVSGLDLNSFKRGKVKILSKESREIQEILMYPEKYIFEYPSVSQAIDNIDGLGKTTFQSVPVDTERDKDVMDYYLNKAIPTKRMRYTNEKEVISTAVNMTAIYIKNKYSLTLGQALTMMAKLQKALAKSRQ